MSTRQFFLVFCPAGPHAPRVQHPDEQVARREAERLASLHPNDSFFVMKAVSVSRSQTVNTWAFDNDGKAVELVDRDISF